MPASSAAGTPTRSQIEAWETAHLEAAATHWTETAQAWEGHFTTIHTGMSRPGGTAWEGAGADSAADSSWGDVVKVRGAADALHSAAAAARNGADDISWAKRQATAAITEAEQAGFTVGEDLSVKENAAGSLMRVSEARKRQMQEFADEIASRAQTLAAVDKAVAGQITGALAPLEGLSFPEDGKPGHEPTVQLVDHRFKLNPQQGDDSDKKPNPKDPHETDPNRSRDGTYGPGNSGDGKAAEKAALDAREQETGIPIIRQQVRATHPDVRHPDGTPQNRYYDGLQPTGNPDEYIGFEAKTNTESLDPKQQRFDAAVSPERPARAMLNGREIKIVGAQVVYPPEGWVPPSQQLGPGAGASAGEATAGRAPVDSGSSRFGGTHAEGAVPVAPTPTPPAPTPTPHFPDWGTHLTPQQLIDSDDPAMRVLGQQLLEQQRQRSGNVYDPDSMA
ncbi:hypothetical protein [Mycobacterium sp. D16Q16]|uniref:hypothetical protein n=1 Tax=Mycobacterium sp. D16Q16 TaxID=1855659 RepID=UPI0009934F22|nr:hypothetical protein [Mycobacterium sp. D16Q16]